MGIEENAQVTSVMVRLSPMKRYQPDWDLTSIPDDVFQSERGRRNRMKQGLPPNLKLKPCKGCQALLSATQRRQRCPDCGFVNVRRDNKGNWIDV